MCLSLFVRPNKTISQPKKQKARNIQDNDSKDAPHSIKQEREKNKILIDIIKTGEN